MAELFGDRGDFAIEAGTEPDGHTAAHVWGHLCVWCGGVALGDLDNRDCGLYDAYTEFEWRSRHLDDLWDDELAVLDDLTAWHFLDALLYGYRDGVELPDDRTMEELTRDSARWYRFNFLTNWDEPFDGTKAFLLSPPGDTARVLSRNFPADRNRGVPVSKRGFIEAATGFARWFEDESRRLGIPCLRPA